jgi:hypothetical protein
LETRRITSHDVIRFNFTCDRIDQSLRRLKQKLPSHCYNGEHILRIAEVKRLTAMLYLKEKLGSYLSGSEHMQQLLSNSQSRSSQEDHWDADRGTSYSSASSPTASNSPSTARVGRPPLSTSANASYSKPHLIAAIIKLIGTFKTPLVTFLWPLFVVGNAGIDDEEQRRFVLDNLRAIQRTRNLGSVRRARMTVERAFRVKDLELPSSHAWGDDGPGVISLA